mmetsp:Transcript_32048/g.94300  ORF Transcript_32048/g.94300 Transcript_32048/m.94300 type:complete len:867 (+) Transcript_32048:407-3007(+)
MRYNDEGFAASGRGWEEERGHSHQGSAPKQSQWLHEQSSYPPHEDQGWQQQKQQWGGDEYGCDHRAPGQDQRPQQQRYDQFESQHQGSNGWRQQQQYSSADAPHYQPNRADGGEWRQGQIRPVDESCPSGNHRDCEGEGWNNQRLEKRYQAQQRKSRVMPAESHASQHQEWRHHQQDRHEPHRQQQQHKSMTVPPQMQNTAPSVPQKDLPLSPASRSQEPGRGEATPVASQPSASTSALPATSSSIVSGPSTIQKMARQLIAKKAREREQKAKEEAQRKAKERELAEAAAASTGGKVSLAQRLHAKGPMPPPESAGAGASLEDEKELGSTKKRKLSEAEGDHADNFDVDADASQLRQTESTDTPNLTENEHTAGEEDVDESAKVGLVPASSTDAEIPAVSESPHSVHSKDVPEPMDVESKHGHGTNDDIEFKSMPPGDVKEPALVKTEPAGATGDDRKTRVLVFSSDSESSDSDTSSSDSDSDDEDMMAWAAKMLQAKQRNVQQEEEEPPTPSAANPMDPDTDVPSPAVGGKSSEPPASLANITKKQKKKRKKKERSSSDATEKKRRSSKPKKPKKTKDQKKLEMLENMYANSDDETGGPNADGTPSGPPTTERVLTDAEVRAILGDDFNTGGSGNYVRRSTRQPSRSVLDHKSVRALISKLENNDRDMAVLKMKKYLPDPDTKPIAIDVVLNALEKNTNCQALYVQNFNEGMRDDQVLHLLRVLQNPSCNIWCLNIGETYNVQDRTWEKFAKGLKKTKVTHMYASEHTIANNLKDYIRLTIRNNRSKHQMHIDPDNLDVIIQCTHCWWNPINAKILRPYLRKKGYEHLLFDKALQGTKDAPAPPIAVANGGETGANQTEISGASN